MLSGHGDGAADFVDNDVAVMKECGRQVTGYNDSIWSGIRQIIVYEGLLAKFSQMIIYAKNCWKRRMPYLQNVQ